MASYPDIDLLDLSRFARNEQHAMFRYLRENDPVSWHEHPLGRGFWNIVRHRDVVTISGRPDLFSSEAGGITILDPAEMAGDADPRGMMMLFMDPPKHSRYRRLVSGAFTPRVIESMQPRLRGIAATAVDQAIAKGTCEFVGDVAAELALGTLTELLGIPYEERALLSAWGNRISFAGADAQAGQDAIVAASELYEYFGEQARSAQATSGGSGGIISTLVNAEIAGEKLTEFEFNMFMLLLTIAGQETTRHTMALGVCALIENPDQAMMLRTDSRWQRPAIEEMLRWASPTQYFRRTATADTELIGHSIRAGDKVVLWYVSANRDDDVFAKPDAFDITRRPNNHLAFGGGGPHFCLGAVLARMELGVLLDELLARKVDLSLIDPPEFLPSNFIRGLRRMNVQFSPVRSARSS